MQRLRKAAPKPETHRQGDGAQEKSEAPAPGRHARLARQPGQGHTHQPAGDAGEILADHLPDSVERPLLGRGGFHEEGCGRSDLASEGETLNHPPGHRQDRSGDTDGGVARRQGQAQDRQPHQGEAEHHRRPPTDPVSIAPDHDRAHRT